jgi:L-iditol 2-dehydrogenase
MKYLICEKENEVTLCEAPMPHPAPGEIVIRMTACGVCATDTMKIYGDGYPKPQKLGHEIVGVVHALGEGVTQFQVGQRVGMAHHTPDYASHYSRRGSETMDPTFKKTNVHPGGFSEYILVPAINVQHLVVPVPDDVPDLRAIFMEPMACCLRGLDRVKLSEGDSALIVGAGAIGMLFVPLLSDRAVTTLVADVRAERIETAVHLGAAGGSLSGRDDAAALCKQHTHGRGVDVVILTVVNDATLALALNSLRDGGTVLLFGGKPHTELKFDYWRAFLREINFISSYSATPDGLKRAMAILAQPRSNKLEALVSHVLPLESGIQGFELVHKGQASKVVITT